MHNILYYIHIRGVFKQNVVDVISWAAEGFRRRLAHGFSSIYYLQL